MDEKTREILQKGVDDIIDELGEGIDIKGITQWAMLELVGNTEKDYKQEIKAAENLAVGYIMGYTARWCHIQIRLTKLDQKSDEIKEKNLTVEESKRVYQRIRLTKNDIEAVREIIQDKLPRIREEVIKALNS